MPDKPTNHRAGSTADKDGSNSGLEGLEALVERAGADGRGLPPVEKWNPESGGEIDMEIRRDGSWFYKGTPIARMPLVRLFSTVLRKDADGTTFLVTPIEKYSIHVEDAHFLAVEMHRGTSGGKPVITFRTNVGDVVEAGPEHPLRFVEEPGHGGIKPYLSVRGRLEALLSRPVTHELLSHGVEIEKDGQSVFAVESNGAVFPVMPSAELERRMADD